MASFQRHLVKRSHLKAKRKRVLVAGLTLTSMVDMFSLLVIFLLQTFSASPELGAVTKGVSLPTAASSQPFADAPVLAIAQEGVYLDQRLIGTVAEIVRDPAPFGQRLAELRELWVKTHPGAKFDGRITLQADREAPSPLVAQIMAFLPSQAYSTIQLAVVARGGT